MSASLAPLLAGLETPWDAELGGLALGWRRLVKREFAGPEELALAERLGLAVALAPDRYGHAADSAEVRRGAGDARTLLLARDSDTLALALELESTATRARGRERQEAEAALGALLGYPPCCVAAHVQAPDQGEDACFARLLALADPCELPAGNNLFVLAHQLISHFPCSLACQASAALAERGLDALAADRPAHARALRTLLAAPITVWDRFRFVIEHPAHGPVIAERLSHAPRLLSHPPYRAFRAALPALPAGGTRLTFATPAGRFE